MGFIKIRIAEDFGHLGSNLEKTIEDMFRSMSPAFSFAERTWRPPMDMRYHIQACRNSIRALRKNSISARAH
jgi:hypothetical protein